MAKAADFFDSLKRHNACARRKNRAAVCYDHGAVCFLHKIAYAM